jgi:hypothetical protein
VRPSSPIHGVTNPLGILLSNDLRRTCLLCEFNELITDASFQRSAWLSAQAVCFFSPLRVPECAEADPLPGGFFLIGGVLLFFDRSMLAMGNILFLIGLTIIIGPAKTAIFFARRQKLKGTAAFATGILLILIRWPLIGFLVELYGIFILFGDFLGTIFGFARNVPVVGPYIGVVVDRAGLGRRNQELPV